MPYTIPQFIEHDPKILWFLTFRQTIYVGTAFILGVILFFLIGKDNILLFIFFAGLLATASLSLAFIQINGKPLSAALGSFLLFFTKQKRYIWRKKDISPKMMTRVLKRESIKKTGDVSLKFAEKSRLKNLSTQLEINA